MNPYEILEKYYEPGTRVHKILVSHSQAVADKALFIAKRSPQELDLKFIEEACLLHDIGIFKVWAKELGCNGQLPYICHGLEGQKILDSLGLYKHGLVCVRHLGMGITKEEIIAQNLPLPHVDFVPITTEEKIICFADAFFSKSSRTQPAEIKTVEVRQKVSKWGKRSLQTFDNWCKEFLI